MTDYQLRLHYDGLSATHGKMPSSLEKQITDGAQMFLGAHAYYHTEQRVPHAVMDRSAFFEIHDVRIQKGSWEAVYNVTIHTAAAYGVAPEFIRDAVKDAIKDLARDAFIDLVRHSVAAWKNRRILVGSPFDRIEPVLDFPSAANEPLFDAMAEDQVQRQRLFERIDRSMSLMSRPIGVAATHCDISLGGVSIHHLDRRILSFSEDDIVEALKPLRARSHHERAVYRGRS